MEFANIKSVYFVGIGGIGMSALARFFRAEEKQVGGYDRTSTPLTEELEREGMLVRYQDSVAAIPSIFAIHRLPWLFYTSDPERT